MSVQNQTQEIVERADNGTIAQELIAQFEGRSVTYGLLARLYEKEVDTELLNALCATRFPANTGNEDMDNAYRTIRDCLCERWERTEEDLRIDYARTFFGNGMTGRSAAYPFESVHTSIERLMKQDARDEVLALYRAAGLTKCESMKDNEDHIALELSYERILGERCAQALAEGDDEVAERLLVKQYVFLVDHLLNWVPFFAKEIDDHSETEFYRAVGKLTLAFLKEDRAFLFGVLSDWGVDAAQFEIEGLESS